MPLIINKKQFSGTSNETRIRAIQELEHLPESITVTNPVSFNNPAPQRIVVGVEGAMIYSHTELHLAIKRQTDCICLYMDNGVERALIHVTAMIPELNLTGLLGKFKNKNGITVMLLGGIENHPRSIHNLNNIMHALLQVTAQFNITIEINSQKLMRRNIFSGKNKNIVVYDKIIEGADFLSKHYFKKDLDKEIVKDFSTEDFKKPYTGPLNTQQIEMFVFMLTHANKLFFSEFTEDFKIPDAMFKKCKESEFIALLKVMFTSSGFEAMAPNFTFNLGSTELYNYAINVKNGTVSEMSEHIEIPDEILQDLIFLDPKRKREYRFCYDGDRYNPISVNGDFITKKCMPLIKKTDISVINEKDIVEFYNALYPDRPLATHASERNQIMRKITKIHLFVSYFKRIHDTVFILSQVMSDIPIFSIIYQDNERQSLTQLNETIKATSTIETAFFAYTRRGPTRQLDALMACKDVQMANEIKDKIKQELNPEVFTCDQGSFVRLPKIRGQV